ncbi:hypothetical protein [Paeniglutamicibacter sp. Y32M11]
MGTHISNMLRKTETPNH